nr:UDP-N-acetylglucosamine pyrophosphorylase [Oscillospiraceae bacterium]
MSEIPRTEELFDLNRTIARPLLEKCIYPHEALPKIGNFIKEFAITLCGEYREIKEGVFAAEDAVIWEGATILGPAIIGHKAEIRPGAFIRENAVVGNGAVIGNSTELKNCIIFDGAQLPHYNYVGDSIIGHRAHLGAGAICSNLRLDKGDVKIKTAEVCLNTGLRKVGAFVGDLAEVGCGCVLCPGSVIGREASVFPLVCVRGFVPKGSTSYGKRN